MIERKWTQSRRHANVNLREDEPELYDAIKDVAPEWWDDDTQITLHKDDARKRQKDRGNSEHTWALWLGHYAGGALNFDDGKRIRGQREWQGPSFQSCSASENDATQTIPSDITN